MTSTDAELRSWRGVPLNVRRSERREQLIDAAYELQGHGGWQSITVRGVCQTARLNPRYFYESFDTLEDLLIALFDRLVAEVTQVALTAIDASGTDPAARATAVIDGLIRYATEDPRRAIILFVEAQGNVRLARRRLGTMHATAEFLERYLWRQTDMAADRVGLVASHLLVGGLTELVITWLDGQLDISLEELVEDAAALTVAVGTGAVSVAQARTSKT